MYSLIEKYWLKKRYIIKYGANMDFMSNNLNISIIKLNEIGKINTLKTNDEYITKIIEKRKGLPQWVLFVYKVDDYVVGCGFLHVPDVIEWNDSLPTKSNEARVSSLFVSKKFRGMGVIGKILKSQYNYCVQNDKFMWSVIEARNSPSLKSSLRVGEICRKNYLVKFLSKNIFSVIVPEFKLFTLLGEKRASR